jgi:hypothetical protein
VLDGFADSAVKNAREEPITKMTTVAITPPAISSASRRGS